MQRHSTIPRTTSPRTADDNIVRKVTLRLSLDIESHLERLTNPNKIRVLLLLHQQIGEQLEALDAITDTDEATASGA